MKILYSPESIEDLKRLRGFIEVKNPQAAKGMADSIVRGIRQLKSFPNLGAEVPQAPKPEMIRDLIIDKYIARYLVHSNTIYILRVWHHKENRL